MAYDRGEAYEELVCVAAPIRSSGQAIAAVSVTGPACRMRWSVVTEAVRGTAAAIWNANLSVRGTVPSRRLPSARYRSQRSGTLIGSCTIEPVTIATLSARLASFRRSMGPPRGWSAARL